MKHDRNLSNRGAAARLAGTNYRSPETETRETETPETRTPEMQRAGSGIFRHAGPLLAVLLAVLCQSISQAMVRPVFILAATSTEIRQPTAR